MPTKDAIYRGPVMPSPLRTGTPRRWNFEPFSFIGSIDYTRFTNHTIYELTLQL